LKFTPAKFNNKTNGISHRRWLLQANPLLAALVTETIGPDWIGAPREAARLLEYAGDPAFQDKVFRVKQQNKIALAKLIRERSGWSVRSGFNLRCPGETDPCL